MKQTNTQNKTLSVFDDRVFEFVQSVPRGMVTTYGDVASAIGMPKASRQVGRALHRNPAPVVIPCHRVVFKDGSLSEGFAFGGREVQKDLLVSEGIEFIEEFKVDMQKHRWKG